MRGFAERASFADALGWLDTQLAKLGQLPSETIPLAGACRRVLAADVTSAVNVPNFQRAMMDGYAVRSSDLLAASAESPIALEVLGECLPGQVFSGEVGEQQAVRIMTGAQLPVGVDAVLPVEMTRTSGDAVFALEPLAAGKNLGAVGEDIRRGEVVLPASRVLRPQDVGLLSSIGQATVAVVRRPRVRIVVTGNELLPAGSQPEGCQIADANGPMLSALVARDGGVPHHPGIVADDRDQIVAALEEDVDVVLVSGGSSVGQEDHVPTLLAEHGELAIHGVAMRPSSPLGMGRLGRRLVFLLPGNPVSCLCGYDFFAGRAIRSLAGRALDWPYRQQRAVLGDTLKSPLHRVDYLRVNLTDSGEVEPIRRSGSSVLSSTTRADGFVVVPADQADLQVGTEVVVWLYD